MPEGVYPTIDAEPWEPQDVYGFDDAFADAWKDSPIPTAYDWFKRKREANEVQLSLDTPSKSFADKVGAVSRDEMEGLVDAGIENEGEAMAFIADYRAKAARNRNREDHPGLQHLAAEMTAWAVPWAAVEFQVMKGLARPLAAMGASRALQSVPARSVMAAGAVESSMETLRVATDTTDTVEDAVINAGLGTLMASSLIGVGGLATNANRGRRKAMFKARSRRAFKAARKRQKKREEVTEQYQPVAEQLDIEDNADQARGRARSNGTHFAASEALANLSMQIQWVRASWDDWKIIAKTYGYKPNDEGFDSFRLGELDDKLRGRKWVIPRTRKQQWGEQVMLVTRKDAAKLGIKGLRGTTTNVLLKRRGHEGEWEVLDQGINATALEQRFADTTPMWYEVESFAGYATHQRMQTPRHLLASDFQANTMNSTARANVIVQAFERDIATLGEDIRQVGREIRDKVVDDPQGDVEYQLQEKRRLYDLLRKERTLLEEDFEIFIKNRNPYNAHFFGKGADKLTAMMRATNQLPFWNIVGNPKLQGTKVGELWQRGAEKLVGTNGAMLPNPERGAVASVDGTVKSRWIGRYAAYEQAVRDAYFEMHNMGKDRGAGYLRWHVTRQWFEERYHRIRPSTETPDVMTWPQFQAKMDRLMQERVANGEDAYTGQPQFLVKAVEAQRSFMRDIEAEAINAGVFAKTQTLQYTVDDLRQQIDELRQEIGLTKADISDMDIAPLPQNRGGASDLYNRAADRQLEIGLERIKQDIALVDEIAKRLGINLRYFTLNDMDALGDKSLEHAAGLRGAGAHTILKDGTSAIHVSAIEPYARTATLLHEIGHAIDSHFFQSASDEMKDALIEDFKKYLYEFKNNPDVSTADIVNMMSGHYAFKKGDGVKRALNEKQKEWVQDFNEWKAEQIRLWLQTNKEPQTIVEKFFAQIADAWRQLVQMIGARRQELGSAAVNEWMEDIWAGRMLPQTPEQIVAGLNRKGLKGASPRRPVRIVMGLSSDYDTWKKNNPPRDPELPNFREIEAELEARRPVPKKEDLEMAGQKPVGGGGGPGGGGPGGPGGEAGGRGPRPQKHRELLDLERKLAKAQDRLTAAQNRPLSDAHYSKRWDIETIDGRIEEFKALLRAHYFTDYHGEKTGAEMVEDIEKRVEKTIATIRGENVYNDHAGIMYFTEQGKPMRPGLLGRRRLNLEPLQQYTIETPDGPKVVTANEFLNPNIVENTRLYVNRVARAIEMTRAFGDLAGETWLAKVVAQSQAEGLDPDVIDKLKTDWRDLRDATLGLDGLTEDPMSTTNRLLRSARYLNVLSFMGRVQQMMLVDLGNLVHVAGFKQLLSVIEMNFAGKGSELGKRLKMQDDNIFAATAEITWMSESATMTNEPIGQVHLQTKGERWLKDKADTFFFWNGAAHVTNMTRSFAGRLIAHDILTLVEKVADDTISTRDMSRLRSVGIDRAKARDIWAEWSALPDADKYYTSQMFGGKTRLPVTMLWQDQDLAAFVAQAVRQEMDNVAFTANAGTRPKILRKEWGRALMLYRTFSIHMTQTQMMRVLQRGPRQMMSSMLAMIGLAFLVNQMRKPDYVEEDLEDSIYQAIIMSGVGGAFADALQTVQDVTGTTAGLSLIGIDSKPWADGFDPFAFNPITSQLGAVPMSILSPDGTVDDFTRGVKYMFPYNNHIMWSSTWDVPNQIRKGMTETLE